jgi:hypothetical protein
VRKQGRTVFYGHAKKSAEIAGLILSELGYAPCEIEKICFFIGHHDDFISWVLPDEPYDRKNPHLIEISAENLKTHMDHVGKQYKSLACTSSLWRELLLLCHADVSAQAELVYRNGIVMDSRAHKQNKISAIEMALMSLSSSHS